MYIYSAMNAGVDAGAGFAAKVTGFETAPGTTTFLDAEAATKGRATFATVHAFPYGETSAGFLSEPVVTLPVATAGETQDDAFARDPIQVVMEARVEPLLPFFPALPIRVVGEAFRERSKVPSMAVPVDCNGNPQGSALYNAEACPCAEDEYWWDNKCVCRYPWGQEGDCGCPAPAVATPDYWSCTCPDAAAMGCGANQIRVESWNYAASPASISCSCQCRSGGFIADGSGGCACPAGKHDDGNNCVCDNSCADGKVTNQQNNCLCECPPGTITLGNGQCGCADPNFRFQIGSGCVCNLTQASCSGGTTFVSSSCSCSCVAPKVQVGGDCVCPAGKVDNGAGGCACSTAPADLCGANTTQNSGTCACACKSGFVPDGPKSCKCPDGKIQSGNSCVCASPPTCTAPKALNNSTCQCECSNTRCTNGGTFDSNACYCNCPSGQTNDGSGRCSCSTGCGSNMTQNTSSCACSCNYGYTMHNGSCLTNTCYQMAINGADCEYHANGSCTCGD